GFAAAVTLTIALGIGATTAMFTVVYGVVLKPLPYGDSDRLVNVWTTAPVHGASPRTRRPGERARFQGPKPCVRGHRCTAADRELQPDWRGRARTTERIACLGKPVFGTASLADLRTCFHRGRGEDRP